jgi:murein DD-endopeptidase MepM/ murein hydrolase activator NlpD
LARPAGRGPIVVVTVALAFAGLMHTDRASASYRYCWPIKPFHTQHPVRGFFGDPRIGLTPHGQTRTFHFGIDISAPNGTPVYAVRSGRVQMRSDRPETVAVDSRDGVVFEYWHIAPAVSSGDRVLARRTVIGHVEAPWGHVHFSELRHGVYVNPLRSGGMHPFADTARPVVKSFRAEQRNKRVPRDRVRGSVDLGR